MISASDVLQVISEIHQYSMLLIELKGAATVGILHSAKDTTSYFKLEAGLNPTERRLLVRQFYDDNLPRMLKGLTVDEFLHEVEGKKAKHIWLETVGKERNEHAFLSISELKTFFRTHSHH